jgi:arabinogalactan oligomer/maltooligosaccharide transport system substrate-binding protein
MKRNLIALLAASLLVGGAWAQGITVWTTFGEETLEWLEAEAAAFTGAFGVSINLVKIPLDDVPPTVIRSAPMGEAADLFVGVPHDQIGGMAAAGTLADMSELAGAEFLADLSDQALLAFTFAGRLFGLPMFVEGPTLIVNNALVPELPDTYEAMIALAETLTTDTTFGYMFDVGNFYFAYHYIRSFGGFVFDRDESGSLTASAVGLASPGAIRGAEELKKLRFTHNLVPSGTNYDVANGLFIDGSLAMIYNGPWAISQYRGAGLDVTVLPVPPLADGTPFGGFMGVQGVLLNEFSNNKVDAANFARWITRPDAQITMAELSGRIPASKSALAQVDDDPILVGFGNALLLAEPMPNIPEMGQVWGPMGSALSVILESAESDVAAILERAAQEVLGN